MDTEEIFQLENSLKNYFLDSVEKNQSNSSNKMKYRGLSLRIEDFRDEEPVFKVRIGAFEAEFRIRDGLKVHGSLCGDERTVTKWFCRGYNQQTLQGLVGKTDMNSPKMVNTNYVDTGLNIDKK